MRRLILFDIDGTLVRGGPAKDAFLKALLETYGTTGDVRGVTFAGKTDPQIARELLTSAGVESEAIDEGLPELWERYARYLAEGLPGTPMRVLPGVVELLVALSALDDVGLGLLTGNIVQGAELKLGSAGLWDHFALGTSPVGGFGSDHEHRDELPAIALERARRRWRREIDAADTIIIGDTPRDVACGLAGGTRTVAVATGSFGVEELGAAGAHDVLEDLSLTAAVVALLTD